MTAVADHGGWPALLGAVCDGRHLDREQAAAAMTDILADSASPAQVAGLIVGLRIKGETVEEMTGLAQAMLGAAKPLAAPDGAIDIVGTGGSPHRRRNALNISTMASIVAAAAGAVVCKHGNRKASSTSGSFDFLEELGVEIDLDPDRLEHCLRRVGLGFAFARTFHPAMRFAGPVRTDLGIPTVFNVLGPLANPARVTRQVVGTGDESMAAKMAAVLANLGSDSAWVVAGHDGLDELTVTGPSVVYAVGAGGIDRSIVDPGPLGLASARSLDELRGGTAAQNATLFRAILAGTETGPRRDIVVLNAAAGLVVAGVEPDLEAGVAAAQAALDDGRAQAKLDQLISVTTAPGASD